MLKMEGMKMRTLGSRLKEAREKKRLTQIDVSKKLGISNGTLSGYERDYRDPDTETLKKLANLYEVSIDWLSGNDIEIKESKTPYTTYDKKMDEVIAAYNRLPEDKKKFVNEIIRTLIKEAEE